MFVHFILRDVIVVTKSVHTIFSIFVVNCHCIFTYFNGFLAGLTYRQVGSADNFLITLKPKDAFGSHKKLLWSAQNLSHNVNKKY